MSIMKRIQFALSESVYAKAKRALAAEGLTWQRWGELKAQEVVSESVDRWGVPLIEMALTRNDFKTKIQEKMIGALKEKSFVVLAKSNDQTKWVEHKEREIERLVSELYDVFDFYETKGNWNKIKAATEAIEYFRKNLKVFRVKAENSYLRYYGVAPKAFDAPALEDFLNFVLDGLPK